MLTFGIPPKPGEVTLDKEKLWDLLYLSGHSQNQESLLAGAGFALGSLLANECETIEDATEIVGEIVEQADEAFRDHNKVYGPSYADAKRLASILEYGLEQGRILRVDLASVE